MSTAPAADDTLVGHDGLLSGWHRDDTLDLTGTTHGQGNQGADTIHAGDSAQTHGGIGNDAPSADAGQTFDDIYYQGAGADAITVTLTAPELAANGAATVALDPSDHLTLNIDPALAGRISVHYNTAGNGDEVLSTEIRVGGQTVAIVNEGLPMLADAITLDHARLTINRA